MKHIKLYEKFINEEIYLTYSEIVGYQFDKFLESYLKLNKDNKTVYDKKEDFTYGFRKGSKTAHWKYDHDNFELHHSEKEFHVLGLINFYKQASKGHPWSK